MPRAVPEDYFHTGVWAPSGPLRFRHLTCLTCGHRSATWPRFLAHRALCRVLRPPGESEDETDMTFLGVPTETLVFGIVLSACVCGALIVVGLLATVINVSHLESEREREEGGW